MELESRLREELRARDPGSQFTARVMSGLAAAPPASPPVARARAWRVPATLVATLFAVAFGVHWHLERQQAATARAQLVLALQITSHELDQVQRRLAQPTTLEN